MSIDNSTYLQTVRGFDQSAYEALLTKAQNEGIDQATLDKNILSALQEGFDFKAATSHVEKNLPSLDEPSYNQKIDEKIMESMLSPLARFGALLVQCASQERETNREAAKAASDAAVSSMREEAGEIRSNALTQMIIGIACGVVTIVAGATQAGLASSGSVAKKVGDSAVGAYSMGVGQSIGGVGSILQSVGGYINSLSEAEQKELQADAEKFRNNKDMVASYSDASTQLINKILDIIQSVAQTENQTRTKIMG